MSGDERSIRARQIIEDEVFIEACEAVERAAVEAMIALPFNDPQKISDYAARVQAVRNVRSAIQSIMLEGLDNATRDQTARGIA